MVRLKIGGSINEVKPLILILEDGVPFVPGDYVDLRYTYFQVICIGAGGGRGGGITDSGYRCTGGAGGGGGLQWVKGDLLWLPASCDVVVGVGGVSGNEDASDTGLTEDGTDGGYSSFNTDTCQASGGIGGKRVTDATGTGSSGASGGEGGVGDSIVAGGGATGGHSGTPVVDGISGDPSDPSTDGEDGTWDGTNGQGGGGGAGGIGKDAGVTILHATSGGKGSYDSDDDSVYVRGTHPMADVITGAIDIVPGGSGGATPFPLTGLDVPYGQSYGEWSQPGQDGLVLIYLT